MSIPICILAGGVGSRLGERVQSTPKPLVEVAGEPFLMHQLRALGGHGPRHVVLCVGYLGELIEERIGSRQFGMDISYVYDGPELVGTAGAVRQALPVLGDAFLVLYGDTYLRVDYGAVERALLRGDTLGLMTVLRNAGRWDRSNAIVADGRVTTYDKLRDHLGMEWIDYGLSAYRAPAFERIPVDERDLSVLQARLAAQRELAAFEVADRFYEIGTLEALAETEVFLLGQSSPAGS